MQTWRDWHADTAGGDAKWGSHVDPVRQLLKKLKRKLLDVLEMPFLGAA